MQFIVRSFIDRVVPGTEEMFMHHIATQCYDDEWAALDELEDGDRIYQIDIDYMDITDEVLALQDDNQ